MKIDGLIVLFCNESRLHALFVGELLALSNLCLRSLVNFLRASNKEGLIIRLLAAICLPHFSVLAMTFAFSFALRQVTARMAW